MQLQRVGPEANLAPHNSAEPTWILRQPAVPRLTACDLKSTCNAATAACTHCSHFKFSDKKIPLNESSAGAQSFDTVASTLPKLIYQNAARMQPKDEVAEHSFLDGLEYASDKCGAKQLVDMQR